MRRRWGEERPWLRRSQSLTLGSRGLKRTIFMKFAGKRPKILFLDVDGVLNTEFCRPRDAIHDKLLRRLGEVITFTGAKIVLSSTWRLHPDYRRKLLFELRAIGVDDSCVVDDTPQLPLKLGAWPPAEAQRAAEIAEWLRQTRLKPATWVAVDDLDLMQSEFASLFAGHFVRTSKESGLSEADCQRLCDILGATT
ncbi:hypothetical protein CTAYLR_004174 [Chrysophaeum taylorii]|uniref:FCP1 homology domain-containing protein n=1 Tax=Chrysophaeum taylorii TaxID=2483200 RepID=A0AAD7UMR2_9STRA|nr:hypothetical protein CTAYLR_004174 [Chrysophaeum taylorii]